jgi:feruloyl esterase
MTAGTDSGHQASAYPEVQAFALNSEALRNFAYASYKNTHDVAIQAAVTYYGKKPTKSYYMGGSEGGREGLTMVQRYPADFDAVFSLAPVINWSGLQTFGNWVGGIKQTGGGWLGVTKIQLVHDTVMSACDALDGLTDGVVNNYVACKPLADAALTAKRCPSGADEGATCLSDAQLSAINGAHAGYTFNFSVANGVTSYPGFSYGGEGLSGNWSSWMTGTVAPTFTAAPNVTGIGNLFAYGNGYVRYFIAQNKDFNPLTYNPDTYKERVLAVSALMDSTNPDLTAFMNRGGKLILAVDMADTAQSPYAGLNYSTTVVTKMGSAAVDTFMRTYALTGLPHTSSGIAASTTPVNAPAYGIPARYDWLAALDRWSTNGIPPADQVVVTTTGALPPYNVTASKPVCRYPNYPKYIGTGTTGGNLASNYVCTAP